MKIGEIWIRTNNEIIPEGEDGAYNPRWNYKIKLIEYNKGLDVYVVEVLAGWSHDGKGVGYIRRLDILANYELESK